MVKLVDGEYLTFVYDGHRTFEVSVYGRSTCKETRAVEEEEDNSKCIVPVGSEEAKTEIPVDAESTNVDVINDSPYFFTSLKSKTTILLIPAGVVTEHNLMFGETITYIDDEGIMEGKRSKCSDGRICFREWGRICRRNRIKEQDTIRCDILHTRKVVHSIKIQIIRA